MSAASRSGGTNRSAAVARRCGHVAGRGDQRLRRLPGLADLVHRQAHEPQAGTQGATAGAPQTDDHPRDAAAGDLLAEGLDLGHPHSVLLFAAAITLVTFAHRRLGLGAALAFWTAYVLTRPLVGSLGDLLSQARADNGLGLGTVGTAALFLGTILAVVTYLTRTRKDATEVTFGSSEDHRRRQRDRRSRHRDDVVAWGWPPAAIRSARTVDRSS